MKRGCLSDRQGKAMIRLGPGKKRELECQIGLIKRDRCFRCFLPSFLQRNRTNWMDFASCVSRPFDQYWIVWMVFFPVCGLPILISLCQGSYFPWTVNKIRPTDCQSENQQFSLYESTDAGPRRPNLGSAVPSRCWRTFGQVYEAFDVHS